MTQYQHILLEPHGAVMVVRLNRPQVLNALNAPMVAEIAAVLTEIALETSVRCVILTGSGTRAFAAGADIAEMQGAAPDSRVAGSWASIAAFNKPLIAAVNGLALGGGMELALICDIILASESARFGQPEINLGIIPGAGGTQRLTKVVGKSLAMEMILNARMLTADEALHVGLVSTVYPAETLLHNALRTAQQIAARAPLAVIAAKKSVNAAFDAHLADGLAVEREQFAGLFGSEDQREGMTAFLEKRRPVWKGK